MHQLHRGFLVLLCALCLAQVKMECLAQEKKDAPQAPLQGDARAAFLKKVEGRMAGVRTVVASFEQEKHLALFGDVVKTNGYILYARPDKLRWEITAPFRSILLVTGRDVARFEFVEGERRRLELGRSSDIILMVMDQIRGWFRGDFAQSTERYDVRVFGPGKDRQARVELRPKDERLARNLQRLELRFAADLASIDRVTIFERGDDRTVMRFTQLRAGAELAAGYFDVRAPRDLDPAAFEKPAPQPVPPKKGR